MVFIRKTKINGKTYLYLVTNQWVKGKVKQKYLAYLGKEENLPKLLEKVLPLRKLTKYDIENLSYSAPLELWKLANEIEILKSYHLRERVANSLQDSFKISNTKNKFSLIFEESSNFQPHSNQVKSVPSIVGMLSSRVSIDQKRGLDIVEVSVESPSPTESALISRKPPTPSENLWLAKI